MTARRCIVCHRLSQIRLCSEACRERRKAWLREGKRGIPRPPGPAPGSTPPPCERDSAMLLHRQARQLLAPLDALARRRRHSERLKGFFR